MPKVDVRKQSRQIGQKIRKKRWHWTLTPTGESWIAWIGPSLALVLYSKTVGAFTVSVFVPEGENGGLKLHELGCSRISRFDNLEDAQRAAELFVADLT